MGYTSVGEASEDYTYFSDLKKQGILLRPSAAWKGNHFIDIRDRRWQDRYCSEIVPAVLKRGFHGIFLDTLDSPLHLESESPKQFGGMIKAATALIRRLRAENPTITLCLNRAYSLLDFVVKNVDIVIGESVYSTYNFDRKEYVPVDAGLYRKQVEWLQAAVRREPKLKVFTLDYWNPSDDTGIRRIYREQRNNGFCPYVSTIDLTKIVREPGV